MIPTVSPAPSSTPTESFEYELNELVVEGVTLLLETSRRRKLQGSGPTDQECQESWVAKVQDLIEAEIQLVIPKYERIKVDVFDASTQSSTGSIALIFSVLIGIRSPVESHDWNRYIEGPFDAQSEKDNFMSFLRDLGCPLYSNVGDLSISNPRSAISNDSDSNKSSNATAGLIAGVAIALVALLLLVALALYLRARRNNRQRDGGKPLIFTHAARSDDEDDHAVFSPEIGVNNATNNEVSTLGDPLPENTSRRSQNEQSTLGSSSLEYDFQKAFLENQSTVASDAVDETVDNDDHAPTLSFSGIIKGGQAFESENESLTTGGFSLEEQFEVVAPPGQLGLILQSSKDGRPSVHKVKATSVLNHVVKVGDRVLSVDGEEVMEYNANRVSRIIASKAGKDRIIRLSRPIDRNNSTVGEMS